MHKSRMAVVVIDCKSDDLDREMEFWAEALGRRREADPIDPKYRDLKGPASEARVLLQSVDHPPRVHLDIETDDIPAEVERLTGLGANVVGDCKGWVVMEAPSGHRFCVVAPQRPDFEENANMWM
ncbi:putative enzyme related to lactoylglutathione lyase [Breoghania corrubedonensis]|uniref:Putative enzyme related to lactoylglutathione lyase n=1 Tax=Breoghania corrubedonensis TaxID=665038 RepID=A0A2T5VGT1_9HYPH|nr:VOC family protein [Breoghania corrubedonensis]PTW62967.1 putative enzyme related to lactoylglutathione lyase [Breoghania corrubedonensis]